MISVESPSTDLSKVLSLLQEYTKTLRETCRQEVERGQKSVIIQGLMAIAVVGSVAATSAFRQAAPQWYDYAVLVAVALAVVVVFPGFFRRSRFKHDADEVAYTLSRLVEAASQLSEHAGQRIGDKFEFDLRVAEAEAVLRMYRNVFNSLLPSPYGSAYPRPSVDQAERRPSLEVPSSTANKEVGTPSRP